jgi:iron complex transport system ATP-binding protein
VSPASTAVAGEKLQDDGAGLRLEVRDLTVCYSSAREQRLALRDVSLQLFAGELLGLVGPNGSGKTTLLRAVTRVVRPLAGQVRVCGDYVSTLSQRELACRVAVVPQDPLLPDSFSAFDCVLMGRTPHLRLLQNEGRLDHEATQRAMILTETQSLAERPVGQLSGGERQRVVVARALAQETPVLLLDEPTAHLDIGHQAGVLGLMRTLCRDQGKAVLAVVHDLTLAASYCDRLVMLRGGGTVVAEGSAADTLTKELLSEVYGADVDVFPHPRTGRPVVAPRTDGA